MKEVIYIEEAAAIRAFVGPSDRMLKKLRKAFEVSIVARGNTIAIDGEDLQVSRAAAVARKMIALLGRSNNADYDEIDGMIDEEVGRNNHSEDPEALQVFPRGKYIVPKTAGQRRFVQSLLSSTVVFGIGPAGTGKTYLSVAAAVSYLRKGLVRRIVLVRPAVEAGEKLGFLPGDLREKVDPYLRPLYDSLADMLEPDHFNKLMASDIIEVAPLAFMRGRTLNKSFVILDEAQNCSIPQMKMFLTRLGFESKAAITGDITQSDLPNGETSGLVHAHRILRNIPGISFNILKHTDIVRHPLVQKIVDAYTKDENKTYVLHEDEAEPQGETE